MNISQIKWPTDARESVNLYLNFVLFSIKELDIRLDSIAGDVINLASQYVNGALDESIRTKELDRLWTYLDDGRLQNFIDKDVLSARIAIALLSPTPEDVSQLGSHLSWFMELLDFMGSDKIQVRNLKDSYFGSNAR